VNSTIRARKLAGLCVDCGDEPPVLGIARCQGCRVAQNERVRERSAARRAAGAMRRWVLA